jgi:hypothetical protein
MSYKSALTQSLPSTTPAITPSQPIATSTTTTSSSWSNYFASQSNSSSNTSTSTVTSSAAAASKPNPSRFAPAPTNTTTTTPSTSAASTQPEALKEYVKRSFASCQSDEERQYVTAELKRIISKVSSEGRTQVCLLTLRIIAFHFRICV